MVTVAWRVDAATARLVASELLGAPSVAKGASVRFAYARLAEEARSWFARLTSDSGRGPVRVVHTRCPAPYGDAHELAASVRCDRVLEIHSAGFDRDRRHPVLDSTVGGAFDQLRAVHDLVSHGHRGFSFDRDGEFSAWLHEEAMYSPVARRALATELHAQHSVLWTSGQMADLKAALLPRELVRAARRARRHRGTPGLGTSTDAGSCRRQAR
jgi:hypothetical protein